MDTITDTSAESLPELTSLRPEQAQAIEREIAWLEQRLAELPPDPPPKPLWQDKPYRCCDGRGFCSRCWPYLRARVEVAS